MARNNLAYYGFLAFAGYTVYGLAYNGHLGTGARKFAQQLKSAWGDTPGKVIGLTGSEKTGGGGNPSPATGTQTVANKPAGGGSTTGPANRWLPTSLVDFGGVPIDYNPATDELRQRESWVAQYAPSYKPNTYASGQFKAPDGAWLDYKGKGQFEDMGTNKLASIQSFIVAVA